MTMGRESNPAGFCPPRQLQVGTSKELPLRKQDTAYWASKASAKCRNYSYRNRGQLMSGKLTPYHEASANSIFRGKLAPEDLHIGGQLSTT